MQNITLTRHSPYTAQQMYNLVVDVDSYHEFIPYCRASRVISRRPHNEGEVLLADVMVAYKFLRETYCSEITLGDDPLAITVTQPDRVGKPFRYLYNHWRFLPEENGSEVHFELQFEFSVPLLRRVLQPIMTRVVARFIDAFEVRAHEIYGQAALTNFTD